MYLRLDWHRLIAGLATGFLCSIAGYFCWGQMAADARWHEIQQEQQKVDQAFEHLKVFRAELNQIYTEVCDEEITLVQAIDLIEKCSQKHYPEFLRRLRYQKKAHGLREAIADNVVGYFTTQMELSSDGSHLVPVLARLKSEHTALFTDDSHAVFAEP